MPTNSSGAITFLFTDREQLHQQAFCLTGFSMEDPEYRQRLELAQLVQAIAWRGEKIGYFLAF